MKNLFLLTSCILFVTLIGCKKRTVEIPENLNNEQVQKDVLFNGWGLTHFENTSTPFVFVNKENIIASIVDEDQNGVFDGSLINTPDGTLLVNFNEDDGLPSQITTSFGETLLFEFKEGGSKVDLAYIYEGEFQYFRDIDNGSASKNDTSFPKFVNSGKPADLVDAFILTGNILSTALSGAFCTAAIAATITSFGGAAPSLWTCAGFISSLGSLIIDSGAVEADPDIFRGSSLIAVGADVVGCNPTSPGNCANAFLGIVSELKSIIDDVKVENGPEISAALGALQSGFGQVKVTLTWTSRADLDLWVTEPNGNKIYFANPSSSTGGFLDFDDLDGPGPENIFWQENAPLGSYLVQVHNYSSNGASSSSYTVQTEINGLVTTYNGSISTDDQVNNIAEFNIGLSNKTTSKTLSKSYKSNLRLVK
ncbi:YfaP family protein [Maribacter sp. 2308TA10-17]|uniref:YfaP family protein n=1 Tax=Maribacter sp. 2308TA10-17 TaxID=3386276 RepID=UPI0039BD7EE8